MGILHGAQKHERPTHGGTPVKHVVFGANEQRLHECRKENEYDARDRDVANHARTAHVSGGSPSSSEPLSSVVEN